MTKKEINELNKNMIVDMIRQEVSKEVTKFLKEKISKDIIEYRVKYKIDYSIRNVFKYNKFNKEVSDKVLDNINI